jgi:hypothetical protein
VIVKQIWTANAYRNFNYLIACSETGEALAIDPLDHENGQPPTSERARSLRLPADFSECSTTSTCGSGLLSAILSLDCLGRRRP